MEEKNSLLERTYKKHNSGQYKRKGWLGKIYFPFYTFQCGLIFKQMN